MSGTDSRIVTMKFDNQQFEQGVQKSIGSMNQLTSTMNAADGSKGLAGLADGASKVSAGFIAMSTIAITALSNITNKAVDAGLQMAKSLTIDPVAAGFQEYELKMGAIQTIMAGSGESLDVVNTKLQELNTYSDKTIYSFKDMTSNIGKFTNAGVSLDQSVASIQGIANVAALSGANAEEASRAMYNFAQSISSGSVKLMDWKSIELANMATVEFKTELMESAVATGKLTKGADGMYKTLEGTPISATKGFNESLQEQWLTSEALTTTLGRYSDATTDIGARATAAATEVKTFSQLMDTLKEGAGSGWATTSELVIGNFEEAKQLWTGLNTSIGGMINASAQHRNDLLTEWKSAGGRDVLLQGLENSVYALGRALAPIKDAFREIFPAKTSVDLYKATLIFREFTEKLTISEETAANLKRTFKGVFAIFSIIWQVVKGVIGVFGQLIGSVSSGSGGFLKFTGNIGDFLVKIDAALKKGDLLKNFFKGLGTVLTTPIELIQMLTGFISDLFTGFDGGAAEGMDRAFGNIGDRFKEFTKGITDGLGSFGDVLERVGDILDPVIDKIKEGLGQLWDAIAEAFSSGNTDTIFKVLNTGIFAMIGIAIKKFLGGGLFGSSGVSGMFGSIGGMFDQLTGSLESMQQRVKADTLIKIAIAIGILALSLAVLALIDPKRLASALAAISVLFIELMVTMKVFEKSVGSKTASKKMMVVAGSLILLAIAILILATAVKMLADLSWNELIKGLLGVAALLAMVVIAVNTMSTSNSKMIRTGAGLILLAVALKILASAVKDFAEMAWGEILKGLTGMAGALVAIAVGMRAMPKGMLAQSIGLVAIGAALKIIASVIQDFADMSWGEIGKGMVGVAGSLVLIAQAIWMFPKDTIVRAVGLIAVAVALKILASALQDMGGMSWEEIAKGLVTLAGSLAILAAGLYLMTGTLAGSAALLVAAVALAVFVPILKALGSMEWGDIVKGLVAIAAVFLILGVAGYLLAPVVIVIAALAVALFAIGMALLAAGVGVLAFATAIALLVTLGAGVAAVITAILGAIILAIPKFMAALAQGIVDFAITLGNGAADIGKAMGKIISEVVRVIIEKTPEVVEAFVTMVTGFLDGIIDLTPKFGEAATVIIETFLQVVSDTVPDFVQTGIDIILAFLRGIGENMRDIVNAGADIIIEFLKGIQDKDQDIIDAGFDTIVSILNGIADGIDEHSHDINAAGRRIAKELLEGLIDALPMGPAGDMAKNMLGLSNQMVTSMEQGLGIHSPSKRFREIGGYAMDGLIQGIDESTSSVEKSITEVGDTALDTMKQLMKDLDKLLAGDMELAPVISPVLDLSGVEKDAARIGSLLTSNATAAVSANQAAVISANQFATQVEEGERTTSAPSTLINFEQHNTSPKALSTVDIYRQTRNQLALAKEALKL